MVSILIFFQSINIGPQHKCFLLINHCNVIIGRKLYWLMEIPMSIQLPGIPLASNSNLPINGDLPIEAKGIPFVD